MSGSGRGIFVPSQVNPILAKSNSTMGNNRPQILQDPSSEGTATDINTSVQDVNTSVGITNTRLNTVISTLGTPEQAPVSVSITHTHVTASNTSTVALAANSSAKFRSFQNIDATNTLTISFSATAVDSTQIVIYPKTSISYSLREGNLDTRVVNCIAASGSPVLLIAEGV